MTASKTIQTNIIASVQNVTKIYRSFNSPFEKFKDLLFYGRGKATEHIALRSVSLDLYRGETLAIVGSNGAGKSTLLQLLNRTLEPTAGRIFVNGRVSALLELGAGFNPEYTGVENVRFYCAILGLSSRETKEKLPLIIEFADIGDFINLPVKTYSSGMFVRLAFAVVIHVEPDILIVDEALAVGDEAFQAKCYTRINHLKNSGTTILLVSHSAQSVISLSDRAVLLDKGEILLQGSPKEVVSHYQKLNFLSKSEADLYRDMLKSVGTKFIESPSAKALRKIDQNLSNDTQTTPEYFDNTLISDPIYYEPSPVKISDSFITTISGKPVNVLLTNQEYILTYKVSFLSDLEHVRFTFMIKQTNGTHLGGGVSAELPGSSLLLAKAGKVYIIKIRFHTYLNPALYLINAAVYGDTGRGSEMIGRTIDLGIFKINPVCKTLGRESVNFNFNFNIDEE